MHCHTEFHSEEGMALYIKVGNTSDMRPAPRGMASCGNFDWSEEEFKENMNGDVPVSAQAKNSTHGMWNSFGLL